jgi:hypothetical protein
MVTTTLFPQKVAILLEFFPKGFLDHVAGPFVFSQNGKFSPQKKVTGHEHSPYCV